MDMIRIMLMTCEWPEIVISWDSLLYEHSPSDLPFCYAWILSWLRPNKYEWYYLTEIIWYYWLLASNNSFFILSYYPWKNIISNSSVASSMRVLFGAPDHASGVSLKVWREDWRIMCMENGGSMQRMWRRFSCTQRGPVFRFSHCACTAQVWRNYSNGLDLELTKLATRWRHTSLT